MSLSTNIGLERKQGQKEMVIVPNASVVDSPMYAMVHKRQDIAHAIGVISRYMENPRRDCCRVIKRIFRYPQDSSEYAICYQEY